VATSLYLRNTTQNGIGTFRDTSLAAGSSTVTGVVNTAASGTNIQWTDTAGGAVLEWVSGRSPAGGWTFAGAGSAPVYCHESDAAANAGLRLRLYKRTAAGVETEIANSPWDAAAEFATAKATVSRAFTPTSTSFAEDDRLVIRLFINGQGGTMAAGHTCTLTYNGSSGNTANSRIIIAENVAFKEEPIRATAAQTAAATTQVATAKVIIKATAAQTAEPTTQTATAKVIVKATAAQTAEPTTQVATATVSPAVPMAAPAPTPPAPPQDGPRDVALVWNADIGQADFAVSAGDLLLDAGLKTAVIISLFTDALADPSDQLPDRTDDRRGWAGDPAGGEAPADRLGSTLWLYEGQRQTEPIRRRIEAAARDALAWMVTDGVADRVEVSAAYPFRDRVDLTVIIHQGGVPSRFDIPWKATA